MTLLGFKASNHPQQTAKRGRDDATDDRRTPADLWAKLHAEFQFTLDAAASPNNALCATYYTPFHDGRVASWEGHSVWCNPPYSDIEPWVRKAWRAMLEEQAVRVVMLLPANRTEQGWWQREVEPHRDAARFPGVDVVLRTRFLPGRLRFTRPTWTPGPKGDRPPFGCVLLIWERS